MLETGRLLNLNFVYEIFEPSRTESTLYKTIKKSLTHKFQNYRKTPWNNLVGFRETYSSNSWEKVFDS